MRRFRLGRGSKSILIFLALMAFFLPAFSLYDRLGSELRITRMGFAATQVAYRFEQLVMSRVEVLGFLRDVVPSISLDSYAEFATWSNRIASDVQGFYCISWIDAEGRLKWIVPYEENKAAIGYKVLGREDVKPYLLAARTARRPQLSHIIPLFRGPLGIVVYVPVFNKDRFLGWVAGVFGVQELIGDLLFTQEFGQHYFRLEFKDHPERIFEQGTLGLESESLEGHYDFQLLNQRVTVLTRFPPGGKPERSLSTLHSLIIFGLVASSSLLSICAYLLMRSRERLHERLEKEHFQSVLLNLLVHDIINPLLIVRFGAEGAGRYVTPELQPHLAKISYGISQLQDVIARVKDMRAIELGKMHLQPSAVAINEIIEDTSRLFEERCKEKGLIPDFQPHPANPKILVDRVTFQNNVINNVISNAIKFSEPGGKITVLGREKDDQVILEVSDQGVGMSDEIREHLFLDHVDITKPGTLGERGTGIGMLQVKSYTHLFGGRVAVHSRSKSKDPVNHGTTICLYLPKAQKDA